MKATRSKVAARDKHRMRIALKKIPQYHPPMSDLDRCTMKRVGDRSGSTRAGAMVYCDNCEEDMPIVAQFTGEDGEDDLFCICEPCLVAALGVLREESGRL